jgi:cell division protein FtsZ
MKRRAFISMAGLSAALGLPMAGKAAQNHSPTESAFSTSGGPTLKKREQRAIIKVVGIGGAGIHAVEHMIRHDVRGVEFVRFDADSPALNPDPISSSVPKFLRRLPGVLVESEPTIGKEWALSKRIRITEMLNGAHLACLAVGMGGGTGTGAAPVVAAVARELGIPTLAVVTTPFAFEGKRLLRARAGLFDLGQSVDALIVIPNEALFKVTGGDVTLFDIFRCADDVMKNVIVGIAENINVPGRANTDFEDLCTMKDAVGRAITYSGTANGIGQGVDKEGNWIAFPLSDVVELHDLRKVLSL